MDKEKTLRKLREEIEEVRKKYGVEFAEVVHGRWKKVEGSSGWEQHRCSVCKKEAIFKVDYIDDYDEGVDGEWEYIGRTENGITEYLTDYCPNCGADMRRKRDGYKETL